jgi:hypothetical protein
MAVACSAGTEATVRPSESIATMNGTTWDRTESRTIPPMATSVVRPHRSAILRQLRSREIRLPYRSSHSRRAARYGLEISAGLARAAARTG